MFTPGARPHIGTVPLIPLSVTGRGLAKVKGYTQQGATLSRDWSGQSTNACESNAPLCAQSCGQFLLREFTCSDSKKNVVHLDVQFLHVICAVGCASFHAME